MSTGNQQILQRYAQPILVSTSKDDTNAPFSFQVWYAINQGIVPGQEFKQYNGYLADWYRNKNKETVDTKLQLKLNYLALLRQLQLFFTQEEAENWYNQVDVENEKELLLAIPYFARKLRDISIYYLQLRNTIKESRFKYNQTGTEYGLTQQVQKNILLNYTQKPTNSITLPASLWKNAPALSSVKDTINVQIQELYDPNNYFDKSPTAENADYLVNDAELEKFLQRKGLNSTSVDWIYKLGVFDLSASVTNQDELDYDTFIELSKRLTEKYISSDKFLLTLPSVSTVQTNFEVFVDQGNNFFYWPYGGYKDLAKNQIKFEPIPLTATDIEQTATAGTTLISADTIFVKTTRGIQGAWLRKEDRVYIPGTMLATLEAEEKTYFRYPFPGYGLSAQDTGWTGYGLKSDPRFFFLDNQTQQLILNAYWTNSFDLTSTTPIKINNSTLVTNKAYANRNYDLADKITVWEVPPSYDVDAFSGTTKEAWLYRFDKTDISIKTGQATTIFWPYESINSSTSQDTIPDYYPNDLTNICQPLPISAINFTFATASNSISSADVIYKLNNYQDSASDAVECAWLSGALQTGFTREVAKTTQSGFQALFTPGTYNRFVWEGSDNTTFNNVFRTIPHNPDCKFVTTPNTTYKDYKLCDCKQTDFSSFGHPGNTVTDNSFFCDFIIEDTITPLSFDITTWKDSTGVPYTSSNQFFWYKTNSKIGFGDGTWVAGGGSNNFDCRLKKGKTYIYYRVANRTASNSSDPFPSLAVRYSFDNYQSSYGSKFKWIRATKTEDGNWISSNEPSEMIIYPGNILSYARAATQDIYYNGLETQEYNVAENHGSVWSNYDFLSIGEDKQVTLNYPSNLYYDKVETLTTGATEISTRYLNEQAFTLVRFSTLSSVNTTPALSATRWTQIRNTTTSPNNIGIYYQSNNTVTFTFQITSFQEILDSTKYLTPTSLNVPASLSAQAQFYIQLTNPTSTILGILPETNNTVTFFYNITGQYAVPPPPPIQIPDVPFYNIVNISFWEVTDPLGYKRIYRTPTATFTPRIPGIYTSRVVAVTATTIPPRTTTLLSPNPQQATFFYTNTGLYAFSNIPAITAVPPFIDVPTLSTYPLNVPGYVLNTPLQGWDYSKSINRQFVRPINSGARPFWAKSYIDKDVSTKYKGINKWGLPLRNVDQYNFIHQPELSDIIFTAGSKITYDRKYSTKLNWEQPVELILTTDKKQWCDLQFNTNATSNIANQLFNYKTELVVDATTDVSQIILNNFVDNEPVEIYYNALNPFTWNITAFSEIPISVTAEPSAIQIIQPIVPWGNLPNKNYPTVAIIPGLKNLYTTTDSGGYFIPNNLGASVYVEQDYFLTLTNYVSTLFSKTGSSRGLTQQDQTSPYTITTDSIWQKEPIISGPIAGTNNKKEFKKHQKFIPYQSNYESNFRNQIGLLNPTSRQTPWTGKENSEWGDSANFPRSFTGELDVSKWSETQVLKKAGLQVDNWVTDIFGNQYGLYKNIKNLSVIERSNVYGQIWVRNNAQFTSSGNTALAEVFDTYKQISLINELTGTGVKKIDMFFDTLMIVTSGIVLFEKINYDYTRNTIFSLADEARYISLAMPVSITIDRELANTDFSNTTYAKVGETWFSPTEKVTYISVCGVQNNALVPELYRLDINTLQLLKIFPFINNDINTITELSSLNIVQIDPPALSYNPFTKEFLLSVAASDVNDNKNIVEFKINNFTQPTLENITVYSSIQSTTLQEPPAVLADLNIQLIKPDPLGPQYTTFIPITAGTKLVLRRNTNGDLSLVTAPVIDSVTVYPLSALSFNGIGEAVYLEPIFNNYTVYDLNQNYINEYGDEELFTVEPLDFVCEPVINTPATFESISLPSWINLTPDGIFTGRTPSTPTSHTGTFKVTNSVGPTFYTLNINIV